MSEIHTLATLSGEFGDLKARVTRLENVLRAVRSQGDPEVFFSYNGAVATGLSGLFWRRTASTLVEVDLIVRGTGASSLDMSVSLNGSDTVYASLPAGMDRIRIPCSMPCVPNQDLIGTEITDGGGCTDLTMILRFDS